MAERTLVTEVVQLGLETTLGTSVAANKRLPSLLVSTAVNAEFSEVVASGLKFPTDQVIGKEWTVGNISGQPTYDELAYLFSSLIDLPEATEIPTDTDAYRWIFTPTSDAEDAPASFTIQQGSAVHAHRYSGAILTSLNLSGNRSALNMSGSFLAQLLTDDITLTANPDTVPQVPLFPKEFDVYVDSAHGDLGDTKMTRAFNWDFSIDNVRGPLWVVNSDHDSWLLPVELMVNANLKLTLEADDLGMGFIESMRDASTHFIRIASESPTEAGDGENYSFMLDFAGKLSEAPAEFSDHDGIVAVEWNFKAVHNPDWGKALEVTLVNSLPDLDS